MGYRLGKLSDPDDELGHEMWTQEIDYEGPAAIHVNKHDGCIEIHGETKEQVLARANAILFGLELLQ
jgi:hypothetical protein